MPSKSRKSDRIRVGIIGAGIGAFHARGYSKCPSVKIEAICDLDTARAGKLASEFGVEKVFSEYKIMLEQEKLDAISVCTPNHLHAKVAVDALHAGCHVLCEKPLSISAEEGQKIVQAAYKAKTKFMVGMNNRFRGDVQVLKKYIDAGELGDIYFAKCAWIRRSGIPGMGSWFTQKEFAGGGPLIDIGVHALDLTLFLMGNPKPTSVFGTTFAKFGPKGKGLGTWGTHIKGGKFDVEDLAIAQIRFANGAVLALEASWAQHIEKDRMNAEVYGDKAGATLDPLKIFTEKHGHRTDISPQFPAVVSHDLCVEHFVECIRLNKQPIPTGDQALDVMKILDGIYKSSETGESVKIG